MVDRLTLIMAWKLSQATAPAARSAPVVPSTTGKRHGCGRSSKRKKPRGGGDRLSPLWTRRAVAELIRKEYGIDMPVRTVGEYLETVGLHCQRCRAVHAKDQDPEEVRALAGGAPIRRSKGGPPVRMPEIHWCDETGSGGRPATATGLRPRRGGRRGSRCPIPTSA